MLFSPHSRLEMEGVKDLPLQVKICFFWRNKSFISCFIKLFFKNGIVRFITLIFENFIKKLRSSNLVKKFIFGNFPLKFIIYF